MPPSNNMGAESTSAPVAPTENQVLIDWLSWTLKVDDPDEAIRLSGLESLPFAMSAGGGMGYKSSKRCGNIVVYFDGNEGMGCHISMTGQGCRQYEAYFKQYNDWYPLLHRLAEHNATVTRIDIAVDNVDGALNLDKLQLAIDDKAVRSRFKGGQKVESFTFSEAETLPPGKTLYLGSKSSRIKFRFYDKAAQLGIAGPWVRCEAQLMSERAQEAVKYLLKNVSMGHLVIAVLNNYFTPVNLDDSNRSRCTTQDWWSLWLSTTEKLKLTTYKALKSIDEVMGHIKRQYSASFAMCKTYLGVVPFHEFITDLVVTGKELLNKKHDIIMQCSRLELEPLCTYLPF